MNITDIQSCADFFRDNYLNTFYLVITYNGNSFILIGEKSNFPHLMGIQNRTYRSNGYNRPQYLFNDIIARNPISTAIIPNNISTTSKMYKKALNFTKSTDIFWKNSGPLTINYNRSQKMTILESCERNNSNLLLDTINMPYYKVIATANNIHCRINGIQYQATILPYINVGNLLLSL